MQWQLEFSTIFEPLLDPQVGLSAADRMEGLSRRFGDTSSFPWVGLLLAVVGLLIVCGMAVVFAAHVKKRDLSRKAFGQGGGSSQDDESSIDLGPFAEGGRVSGMQGRSAGARDVAKILVNPVEVWKGDMLVVRYPKGSVMWEFDARLSNAGEEVVVRPLGPARWVDRRVFERIKVDAKAMVAPLPFERTGPVDQAHCFVEARLTEMAAIGLRFEAPVDVQVGQRMLVILDLAGQRQVEAMGIVRRCWDPTAWGHDFAVELVGLHSDEVDQLVRETEAAGNGEAPEQVLEEAPAEAEPATARV